MNLTLITALTICLQYAACVGLYHSNERRSTIDLFIRSKVARITLKSCATLTLLISLVLCSDLQGWERGIPIWLCLIGFSGFVSLYLSAYKPSHHVKSGLVALSLTLVLTSTLLIFASASTPSEQLPMSQHHD